jgi:hypothetical protein
VATHFEKGNSKFVFEKRVPKPARIPPQVTDIFLLENSATPTQTAVFRL